ncbi:RDD family protein [Lysinibacter sp. HNR]|uniref:RDD family protein n=1 Tax=Lysinibacter sp. HNR TaxID=3031408 RepID=UPI00243561EB|nr:RDD family protein [Lysinibacter sp. HNR]WGD36166.1 RDD family protein [Lysinibacter sp. HNR]
MQDSSPNPQTFGEAAPSTWPGERLGLAASGRGSIARVGRRIIALLVDWGIAMLLSYAFFGSEALANLIIFMVMQVVFIPTIGGSLGHRLLGMRVIALNGKWVGPWRPLVRTVLLCLVLPVLVWDSDQRAFHDKIPGTALIIA